MTRLTKLLLSDNKITYLPPRTFESLAKLNELIVSSNFIQYLSMDTFYGLASLTKLDLSSNEILFINDDVFQPLQALTHLWLFKNKLTALASMPDSLTSLSLNENPWTCTCHLVSSMQLLKEKVQTPSGLVCNSPPSLKGRHMLSVRPEVCAFPTRTGNLPQESTSKFNTLYGFTGGLFFSFIMCLIVYFITKHWKYSRVTNQAEDGHVLQKDSVEEFPRSVTNAPSVSPLPHRCVTKANRTRAFQKESEADTIEKALCDHLNNASESSREHSETSSPVKMPGVALLPTLSPSGQKIMTICKEGMEIERLTESPDKDTSPALQQVANKNVERAVEIPRCVSAPGSLPNVEKQPSPKRDHGWHCSSLSHEKTIPMREWMENGEPALVKYFETQWEEQALSPITWFSGSLCSRALVNVVSPAGSATHIQTGRDRIHTTSNNRSQSWSPFHFNISSHLTAAHGDNASRGNAENGFEANSVPSRRETDCETLCQEHFIKRESTDTTEDRSKDQGMKEPDLQKDIYLKNCCIAPSESNNQRKTTNTRDVNLTPEPEAQADSPLSDLASPKEHAGASNADKKVIKPAVEGKLVSPFLGKEDIHPQSFCNNNKLGEERPSCKIPRSEKPDKESSLKKNKLTKERFWKYHTNCCNEYQPCPTAQRVLKELKTALLTSREQLDLSTQAPPSDMDLLKEQEVTTTFLAQCINSEEPLTNKWEKGNYCTLPDVHASFAPDGICHQELPGDDSNISCELPQTVTLQLGQQTNISHQEAGAECQPPSKTIVEPINEFQESTEKCIVKDQSRIVDSLEQLQLGNFSVGANHLPSRRCENARNEHVAQDWKSLDAETDSDALTQTYNTINEHFAGGEEGCVPASLSILHRELCHVKSLQLSAMASVYTCLPLSADESTLDPDSLTSSPNSSKVSLLDVHEVERKGVADRESSRCLSNEVISVQKMHISPSEEKSVGRLRAESADAEFMLNENEGAQFNIDEKTKAFQSDCTEHTSYEVVKVISSNDTDDEKNVRELLVPSDILRIENNTWHNTDNNPCRSCLENACSSIAANCNECDDVGCKKVTGHECLYQPAASARPSLTVYESQAEEISVAGYDGTVTHSCQASRNTGIQQFACNKKDKFQLQDAQVNPKTENEPDMKYSNSKYHMLVTGNTDAKLCVAGDNPSASPYLESRQPLEIGLHSKTICLPEQSHRSLLQQGSALSDPRKKELEQHWNESPSAKQLKKTYCSVFRLPTEGPSFGKLCQNLDCTIEPPDLSKGTSPTTPLTPNPCLLGQETEIHANGESWAFNPHPMDKATHLSCLYNPKTPRKQANERSVLSNLRYCKISAKVSFGVEEEEWRSVSQKKENGPDQLTSDHQYKPPAKKEVTTDSN
ncbi:immunoglobulin superfamily member 10 [Chelydra serpentina]|nr:immunoglobulin superfamily member 10 [Chelydra serpentina]